MPISDTSPQDMEIPPEMQRKMTGEQRLLLALEMSMRTKELTKARIRREHPDWTEAQVARELLRLEFLPDPLPRGF